MHKEKLVAHKVVGPSLGPLNKRMILGLIAFMPNKTQGKKGYQ